MDDPEAANEAVANAKYSTHAEEVDVPIGGLMALHDIDRDKARSLMNSIKSRGYDPNERIEVLGDKEGGIVLEGHHRAVAARAAGMRKIPAYVYDSRDIRSAIDYQ
jgi:ParB-like chromosome segregation protein Spo0J